MQITNQIDQPILQIGSRGPKVRELQEVLQQNVSIGGLEVDGIFGEITELAVKVFQFRVFLEDDGVVGPKTWKALHAGGPVDLPLLKRGSHGAEVARVQRVLKFEELAREALNSDGYYHGAINGDFGAQTETAVKTFQSDNSLLVDGVIGDRTWRALSALAAFISHLSL